MKYSLKIPKGNLVTAQKYDINASYKQLSAVCDAIRYLKASNAMEMLDSLIAMEMPIPFKRHNKGMGSRHELGGRKGAWPVKAAKYVRLVLINAMANANSKGFDGSEMFIIHAAANKTRIERRYPSKGGIYWGRGMYGRSAIRHSDLEYAKVEIALAEEGSESITKNMKYFIKKKNAEYRPREPVAQPGKPKEKRPEKEKEEAKALPVEAVEKG
ncbi:MAG: 50S ribosomal protein L22 [Candidatus Micrarchaeaceae archaeon]